ncbi:FliO/MopB family protein [bacterium]|nr:FliO/MopB family protein [bacterium]
MGGYLLNFAVYTAAMIGVIFIAILAYKNFSFSKSTNSRFLNVEDSLNLAPRKNLYIVRAGDERFLIASDSDRTSLISKLGNSQNLQNVQNIIDNQSVDDLPVIVDFTQKKKTGRTAEEVLKNIAKNV